ncbi:hypothetical protein VPH35_036907 [Triticum aestivum]|uniref:Uncharacterized protein n=1 Tax=Aegilops tauschii subsp. strangulata TaxID=200361 RepID=A0A453BKY0_AEGTS
MPPMIAPLLRPLCPKQLHMLSPRKQQNMEWVPGRALGKELIRQAMCMINMSRMLSQGLCLLQPCSRLLPGAKTGDPDQTKGPGGEEKLHVNPTLKHTRVPLDMGVPYTPRVDHPVKGTTKKVAIDIPNTTPRPTAKPKDA